MPRRYEQLADRVARLSARVHPRLRRWVLYPIWRWLVGRANCIYHRKERNSNE